MQYNAQAARNYLSNRTRAKKDIDTPYWSEIDADGNEIGLQGHIQVRKLSGDEGFAIDNIEDTETRTAFMLALGLILKDTGEQLFQATGSSMLTDLDLEDMKALSVEVKQFNGLLPVPVAVEEKKESSSPALESVPSSN